MITGFFLFIDLHDLNLLFLSPKLINSMVVSGPPPPPWASLAWHNRPRRGGSGPGPIYANMFQAYNTIMAAIFQVTMSIQPV